MKQLLLIAILFFGCVQAQSQSSFRKENPYYDRIPLPIPEGVLLEVGGLTTLPDGRIALCTRRGEVWVVENPAMYGGRDPRFTLFASGLHEPLGLAYRNGVLYAAQRGELTRLVDTDGDDRADRYETIYDWPLSGHYHEYSFGPKFFPDGSMVVTANVAFGDEEWWRGESRAPWRGWTMRIYEDGRMAPWATGMRSPCGLGMIDGEFFYTENQGDWVGSGGIWHVKKGSFTGHPAGLRWAAEPDSPVDLTAEAFFARVDRRQVKKDGRYVKPDNIPDEADPDLLVEVKKDFPALQLPAVWLPHGILGISTSEIVVDSTGGAFGPFGGQLFVGDQGQSKIMRVDLEKVKGEYQGVAFDFYDGFQSGVLRMTWGHDGALYVGETNRGWGSAGTEHSGLERLAWTGRTPFEMKTVKVRPDGFEIEFTLPVDREHARDLDRYTGRSFTYKYHPVYGSPTILEDTLQIEGLIVSEDGRKVRLQVANLRPHFIHELRLDGIRAARDTSLALLHPAAYYTLHHIPEGEKLADDAWSRFSASAYRAEQEARRRALAETKKKRAAKRSRPPQPQPKPKTVSKAPTYAEIEPLLVKNTCIACHRPDQKQVGPAYREVARRNYSVERIVELIYNPEPDNWPGYTPMAPMPQVPRAEAVKIAQWINSLD